jgi:hypothetical protein
LAVLGSLQLLNQNRRDLHADAQEEAVRLVARGNFSEARKVVADLIEDANQTRIDILALR